MRPLLPVPCRLRGWCPCRGVGRRAGARAIQPLTAASADCAGADHCGLCRADCEGGCGLQAGRVALLCDEVMRALSPVPTAKLGARRPVTPAVGPPCMQQHSQLLSTAVNVIATKLRAKPEP